MADPLTVHCAHCPRTGPLAVLHPIDMEEYGIDWRVKPVARNRVRLTQPDGPPRPGEDFGSWRDRHRPTGARYRPALDNAPDVDEVLGGRKPGKLWKLQCRSCGRTVSQRHGTLLAEADRAREVGADRILAHGDGTCAATRTLPFG